MGQGRLRAFFIAVSLLVAQGVALWQFGQPPICECGYVKLWEGVVLSAGNSQHLADWYSPSHVIHGFLFYAFLWWLFPRMPVARRLLLSIAMEAGWEVFENTPLIIEHYREQALAQGYIGDSVINSVSDTLAMALGFLLAWRLPVWATVAVALALEAFVGYSIRDNLTLNITNFIHQFDFIDAWQRGA